MKHRLFTTTMQTWHKIYNKNKEGLTGGVQHQPSLFFFFFLVLPFRSFTC